jgi:amino acid transporter
VAVAASTFGGLNGILFTTARLFYVASQEKQVPEMMGMISVNRSTPTPSLLVSCLITLAMLVQPDVYALINYFSFTLWLWTGIATAALIYLRFKRPDINRPIRFPLILPIVFTTGCFVLTAFAIYSDPVSAGYGSILFVLGVPVYFLQRYYNKPRPRNGNRAGCLTLMVQKLLLVSFPDEVSNSTDL